MPRNKVGRRAKRKSLRCIQTTLALYFVFTPEWNTSRSGPMPSQREVRRSQKGDDPSPTHQPSRAPRLCWRFPCMIITLSCPFLPTIECAESCTRSRLPSSTKRVRERILDSATASPDGPVLAGRKGGCVRASNRQSSASFLASWLPESRTGTYCPGKCKSPSTRREIPHWSSRAYTHRRLQPNVLDENAAN